MKKIVDWSKPIRYNGHRGRDITDLRTSVNMRTDQGYQILMYNMHGSAFYTIADAFGKILGTDNFYVENIPEEPKDHIVVFKSRHWQEYQIDPGGPFTEARANEIVEKYKEKYDFIGIMKVL